MVNKSNKTLGMLRRHLWKAPPKTKELAFQALVRSRLDYCAPIWDPTYPKPHIQSRNGATTCSEIHSGHLRPIRFCFRNADTAQMVPLPSEGNRNVSCYFTKLWMTWWLWKSPGISPNIPAGVATSIAIHSINPPLPVIHTNFYFFLELSQHGMPSLTPLSQPRQWRHSSNPS